MQEQRLQRSGTNPTAGLYILEFPPPGGGESKGLEMGKEIKGGKKRKKRKFRENMTFYSTKS